VHVIEVHLGSTRRYIEQSLPPIISRRSGFRLKTYNHKILVHARFSRIIHAYVMYSIYVRISIRNERERERERENLLIYNG
jgi:hypothetical protein